ncbi:nucleobase:cation symporter-2 family protein [Sporosalibacterium faouarense]|uniref:nucleobase:cation symporter-2 family protein n=1 Tax=Sporosalibacterium faouarense TaxID=516123 RepID=UPI00141D0DAD|nr:nucleobase:cation symporter-2 family protein [Sporosalibacterium faouarense]MTI46991.1 purine permease [Bacillota bacterium]
MDSGGKIVNTEVEQKDELLYHINDKPSLAVAIPLAIQNIVAAFSGIIAVPLVVGSAIGLTPEQMTFIVNATLFMAGVATFIQAYGIGPIGSKLPCIMGTDFTFVGPSIAVGSTMGLPGIFGATILGSFVEIILSRFIKPLMRFFPPVVTGTVVSLIGLTIMPVAVDWAAGGTGASDYGSLENIFLALVVMAIIVVLNQWGKGFTRAGAILIGIIVGYFVSYFMGKLDFSQVTNASWVSFPTPFKYGVKFSLPALLAFIPAYLVTTVESIGDLLAVGEASQHDVSGEELGGGLLADGVGSFFAGIFNAGPNTSFSQNVGIIPVTGVASRFVIIIAGVILMISGLLPKLGALIAIMPNAVLGGAGIIMFGMIAVGGFKILQKVNFTRRNSLVVAISIGLGMAVVVRPDVLSHLPNGLQVVLSSGIATGTITALLLNLILPNTKVAE